MTCFSCSVRYGSSASLWWLLCSLLLLLLVLVSFLDFSAPSTHEYSKVYNEFEVRIARPADTVGVMDWRLSKTA